MHAVRRLEQHGVARAHERRKRLFRSSGIRRLAAGPLWRPLAWLGLYAGAGYAAEELDWQDAEGHWARVQDFSFGSVCWDAGVLLNWKHLAFSAGCSWCPFATVTAGVGVHF